MLDNLIGISDSIKGDAPESGLFLDQLPYISIEKAQAAKSKADQSAVALLQGRIDYAQEKIENDLRLRLRPFFDMPSNISKGVLGIYEENQQIVTGALERGIRIRIDEGNYLRFNLLSFTLLWDADIDTNVIVYDLITGETLDTIPITTVANRKVTVNITTNIGKYDTNKQKLHLLIATDATLSGAFKTDLDSTFGSGCHTCNHSNDLFNVDAVSISGIKKDENTNSIGDTHGLSIEYALECSVESMLCSMKNLFAFPFRYLAGAEVLEFMQSSTELNGIILLYTEDRVIELEKARADYEESLNMALESMRPQDELCLFQRTSIVSSSGLQ